MPYKGNWLHMPSFQSSTHTCLHWHTPPREKLSPKVLFCPLAAEPRHPYFWWHARAQVKNICIFLINFQLFSVSSNAFYFWTADNQTDRSVRSFIACVSLLFRKPWRQSPDNKLLQCCLFYFARKLKASPSPLGSNKIFFLLW